MSALVVLSSDRTFEKRVRSVAAGRGVTVARLWRDVYAHVDPTKVVDDVAQQDASVVCLGPGLDRDLTVALASAFDREQPGIVVIVAETPTPELWQAVITVGVRDVVEPLAATDEMDAALGRALEIASRRHVRHAGASDAVDSARRVVSVVSPKGGSGKTMVVSNLGVVLATVLPSQVAAVDLDLQFGDLAAGLALTPQHTMTDVARTPDTDDATALKVFLSAHESGLYALCAPESPIDGDSVSYADGARAVRLLSTEFPMVLVDTAAGLDASTLAALELSTDVVFVCTTDVASVRGLRKELDALDGLGMKDHRRHFVLNRADAKVGLEQGDIESVVGLRVDVAVPSSRVVPLSLNQGQPIVLSQPRSPVAKPLRALAERLVPELRGPTATSAKRAWRR